MQPVRSWQFPVEAVGSSQKDNRPVLAQQTNADYLRVMGLKLVQGRFLNEDEVEAQRHSIAVNQTLVRRYFSGGEAIGRLMRIPLLRAPPLNLADDSFQIVGWSLTP